MCGVQIYIEGCIESFAWYIFSLLVTIYVLSN